MISDKPGDTFASILFRHMDRLSFMVQTLLFESGSGANVFSDDKIRTFYLNLLHLEGLLYPHLDDKYRDNMEEVKNDLFANRNNIRKDPVAYFIKCEEWFAGLNVVSYNAGFTSVDKSVNAFDEDEDNDAEED